jgi:DNA-binding NarL/FixJ family response regulator
LTADSYRVLIADDHPLYRSAMCNVLTEVFPDAALLECEDLGAALEHLQRDSIDLVLLDLNMPDAAGTEGLARLRSSAPSTPVVVCSALDEPALVRECFQLGAAGYLPKSSGMDITRSALQLVRGGGVYVPSEALAESPVSDENGETTNAEAAGTASDLTPRQRTVLSLLERGMSNKAIARELGIGEITVKAHVSAILRKLGVENRLQAIIAVREKNA